MTAGISRIDYDLSDKGVPQGPRSAIIHNNWVKEQGLADVIALLTPGEKYKRCYLKTPNQFNSDVVSYFDDRIADIIKQDGIYDYSLNFDKYFEKPLENMSSSLGYNIANKHNLVLW